MPTSISGGGGNRAPASVGQEEEATIYVSRLFASGSSLQPKHYLGFAVLAFPQRPVEPADYARFEMICLAFRGSLSSALTLKYPSDSKKNVATDQQVVTVLPVKNDQLAEGRGPSVDTEQDIAARIEALPTGNDKEACELAAQYYDLEAGQAAIRDAKKAARRAGFDWIDLDKGAGPFLLAWNPGEDKGEDAALVLVANLSNTSTYAQARTDFRHWRQEVEKRPELWMRGPWNAELARREAQRWLDRNIGLALRFLGH